MAPPPSLRLCNFVLQRTAEWCHVHDLPERQDGPLRGLHDLFHMPHWILLPIFDGGSDALRRRYILKRSRKRLGRGLHAMPPRRVRTFQRHVGVHHVPRQQLVSRRAADDYGCGVAYWNLQSQY
jgi:hypothetical protein